MTGQSKQYYGAPGTFILPRSVRQAHPNRPLDSRLAHAADSKQSACWADARFGTAANWVELPNALTRLLTSEPVSALRIAPLLAEGGGISASHLTGLAQAYVLRARTEKLLFRLQSRNELRTTTFRSALDLRGIGAVTVLDLATALERIADMADQLREERLHSSRRNPAPRPVLRQAAWVSLPDDVSHSLRTAMVDPRLSRWRDSVDVDRGVVKSEAAGEITVAIRRMSNQTVEEGAQEYLRTLMPKLKDPDKWFAALCRRLGLDGLPPATLAEVGSQVGKTRERVRQVEARVSRSRASGPAFIPALDSLVAEILRQIPMPAADLGPLARHGSHAAATLTFAGLRGIADFTGHLAAMEGLHVDNGWLVPLSDVSTYADAERLLARHTSKYGATTIEVILDELRRKGASVPNAEALRRFLSGRPNVAGSSDGWLFVVRTGDSPHENSLRNHFINMLSVVDRQHVGDLIDGLARSYRFRRRDVVPSMKAALSVCDSFSDFIVDGEHISLAQPVDYHSVLGDVSATVVDIFKGTPHGIMDRRSLNEAAAEAGVAAATIGVWTTYAEWMKRFDTNVWGLRGLKPSPAVVAIVKDSARRRSSREPNETAWHWLPDGRIRLLSRMNHSRMSANAAHLPSELRNILRGQRYRIACACHANGGGFGEIATSAVHTWFWGYAKWLKGHGAEWGNALQLDFELGAGVVWCSLRKGHDFG